MDLQGMKLAIVGATGAVGQETLRLIEERYPHHDNLKLLASKRSAGRRLEVNGKTFTVEETTDDSFADVDIAFISARTEDSRRFGPSAAQAGALVIDDSSAFRMDPAVPLIVPEINGEDLDWHDGIVSIPNCSTTPLVMVVHPLRQASPIRRIVADTYQSVSGAGGAAMNELRDQTRTVMHGGPGRARCPAPADRLQRHSPNRQLQPVWIYAGRAENDRREPQNPARAGYRGFGNLRSRASVCFSLRGNSPGVRQAGVSWRSSGDAERDARRNGPG